MKKPIDNSDKPTSKKIQLAPISNNNESNPIIDVANEFVLFPLDVQESNTITQNSTASQDDDFILFPLDVKITSTNTNNPAPITNQKTNKPNRQFVTKPNPQPINVNPQPSNPPNPSPILVNRPTNKKVRNLFWFIVISLSIYTFIYKESNESYLHFFSKTRHKIGNTFNNLKSNFINEDDFKEFIKGKQIIYSPYLDYIEDDSGEINEVKGDSIIIIEPTGNKYKAFYLPAGKTFKLKVGHNEYSLARIAENNIYLDVNQKEFEKLGDWNRKISVFIDNENSTFSQEIIINKIDIAIDKEDRIEIRYMRNRIEDFKSNTILTKYVSKSLLDNKNNKVIKSVNSNNESTNGNTNYNNIDANVNQNITEKKEVEDGQNREMPLYPDDYSNIISEIITNYYDDLNNNNFDAEKYYAKNVDQFISIKNTNPTNINELKNNDDYQDGVSIVDESSITLTKNNPNNYYSCWNYNVKYECFRPSKNKYQKCNFTIYLGFDENNHIVSYLEKNVRNLKFYD